MTKEEFIKNLYNSNLGDDPSGIKPLIETYFPELTKVFENGDIVCFVGQEDSTVMKITDIDRGGAFGFNNGGWKNESTGWSFRGNPQAWKKTTTGVWGKMLIKECKSRGIWDTEYVCLIGSFKPKQAEFIEYYDPIHDHLWSRFGVVYSKGEFAQPKPKTELDLEIEHLEKLSFKLKPQDSIRMVMPDLDRQTLDRTINRLKKLRVDDV